MIEVKKDPNINLDRIFFGAPEKEEDRNYAERNLARFQPVIFINGKDVGWENISNFEIDYTGFLPKVRMTFFDELQLFTNQLAITNGDLLSFYFRGPKTGINPIRIDFYITKSVPTTDRNGKIEFFLKGIIHIPELWSEYCRSYNDDSYGALFELSEELGLGFTSNVDGTSDNMKWQATFLTRIEMIKHLTQHAYSSNTSFFTSFVDLYYNLNFIEVNREIPRADLLLEEYIEEGKLNWEDKETDEVPLILSNFDLPEISSLSFKNPSFIDESGEISLLEGYGKEIQYYDEISREPIQEQLFPLITEGDNESFLMRGRLGDDYYRRMKSHRFRGIEFNRDNMHENFRYAEFLNYQNNQELQKLKLSIDLERVNLSLYRYQQIPLFFVRDWNDNEEFTFNKFLSGNFLIGGFKFFKSKKNELSQRLYLIRREWPNPQEKR